MKKKLIRFMLAGFLVIMPFSLCSTKVEAATEYKISDACYDEQTGIFEKTDPTTEGDFKGTCKNEAFIKTYKEYNWNYPILSLFNPHTKVTYDNLDTIAYCGYYLGITNAPFYSKSLGYLEDCPYTYESKEQTITAVESSLSTTLSLKQYSNLTKNQEYAGLKSTTSKYQEVNKSIEANDLKSHSSTNIPFIGTFNISKSGNYFLDRRGLFDTYVVKVYHVNYNKVKCAHQENKFSTKTEYQYEICGYTLSEIYIAFCLKVDLGICLTRYTLDQEQNYVYEGPKENLPFMYL